MKTINFILFLIIISLVGSLNLFSQEIPNGDGDLLWERSIYPRFVNDAKFHPINGNIIAAVNHEIWEIDPKDGHTIRVFEGETGIEYSGWIDISSDGNYIVLSNGGGTNIKLYGYNEGKIIKYINMGPWSSVDFYPNSTKILFNQAKKLFIYDVLTNQLVKESVSLSSDNAFMRFKLSKDGKYIAIGMSQNQGEYYTMELWDAETLTKIKDFGEDNTIGEFNDIQISNNNKYVAFQGGGHLNLYYLNGEKIGLFLKDYFQTFCFSYDGNYTIIGGLKQNYYQVYVMRNPLEKELYTYSKMIQNFRVNLLNEIFCGSEKIKLYSNKWFTVGIKPNIETKTIISPNPATDYISLGVQNIEPLQEIEIYNVFGERVMSVETQCIASLQRIDVSALPPGVYFVKVGNEKPNKFIKL